MQTSFVKLQECKKLESFINSYFFGGGLKPLVGCDVFELLCCHQWMSVRGVRDQDTP